MLVVVVDGRSELAIEFLLLLRRQQRSNLVVGLKDQLLTLTMKTLVQLIHLEVRVAHQGVDLMPLIGAQFELVVEPLDKAVGAGHPEHSMTVCGSGESESDQHAGDNRQRDSAPFQAIAQSR